MSHSKRGTTSYVSASSRLLGFISRRSVRGGAAYPLAEVRADGFPWLRRDGVIYRKDAYLVPAAKRFIEILKAVAKESAPENVRR